jgi:predicted O-methyltransferase YrrM
MKGVPLNEELYNYIVDTFVQEDDILKGIVKGTKENKIPLIQVSPDNGKFLFLLIKMIGAKRVLEIGTLAGYSTIWMARALPEGGKLVTLEISKEHAEFAQGNFKKAGLENKIQLVFGKAMDSLEKLLETTHSKDKFDFVFIDADKENSSAYFDKAIKLTNSGGVIATDNTLKNGNVIKKDVDEGTKGIQLYNKKAANDPRVESLLVSISDGLTISRVK